MTVRAILFVALVAAACDDAADALTPADGGTLDADGTPGETGPRDGGEPDGPDAGEPDGPDAGGSDSGRADAGALGPAQVRVTGGVLQGERAGPLLVGLGIPYAAPPIGVMRFRPPGPVVPWDGVRPATALGAVCPQRSRAGQLVGDEDCLTLNVWGFADGGARPVMVWIHGGGFVQGSSAVPLYDGARLAEDQDVVVVSINYRLGALGFLATEALIEESAADTAGNYGILDQVQALAWVADNIAAFGGDSSRVTIFGESAGGASVCALLATTGTEGLFHRAIMQSGGGCYSFPALRGGNGSALAIGAELMTAIGCADDVDPLACARARPFAAWTEALFQVSSSAFGLPDVGPAVDGVVLPELPYVAILNGRGRAVPIMSGSNADEAVTFTAAIQIDTREDLSNTLARTVPPALVTPLLNLYSEDDFPDAKDAYNALFSDISFNCASESLVRAAAGGAEPAYMYYFNHRLNGIFGARGVVHGSEIGFVFGTLDAYAGYQPTAEDERVSAFMRRAWASFARSGTPATTPEWSAASGPTWPYMAITGTPTVETVFRNGRCTTLRTLGLVR